MLGFLMSFALLAGALVLYTSFIRPAYRSVNELRGELFSKEDFYDQQQKIIGEIEDILVQYANVKDFQANVSLALPNREDVPSLFNQVYTMANISQLALRSMNLSVQLPKGRAAQKGKATPVVRVGTVELTLQLQGTYESFKRFLRMAETNIRLMDIKRVNFAGSGKESSFSYNVVIDTYYQTEQ